MAEQHIKRTITYTEPRWATDAGTEKTIDMYEAQYTTGKKFNFETWHLEAVNGMSYPESKLVEYKGGWYLPKHLRDILHDETTTGG